MVMRLFCKMVVVINTHTLSDLLVLSITVGANKQVKLRKLLYFQAYV